MRALLISNPLSGHYSDKKINFLISSLNKRNVVIERYNLEKEENIESVISKLDSNIYSDLLFSFGDGTINSDCNALLNRDDYYKFNILIVPMGTANVVAMELNCNTIKRATKAFLKGHTKKVHIGLANDRYFISMASTGFDSLAVENVNKNIKKKIGKLAYIISTIKVLFSKNRKNIVTNIDGINYDNILTCASNGKYYGIKLKSTDSNIEDNIFDIILIKKFNIFHMIKYLFQRKSNSSVIYLKSKSLNINSEHNYPFQLDGDCHGNLPLNISSTDKFINFYYL